MLVNQLVLFLCKIVIEMSSSKGETWKLDVLKMAACWLRVGNTEVYIMIYCSHNCVCDKTCEFIYLKLIMKICFFGVLFFVLRSS